ncbi:MAG: hypothetical protein D3908_03530, partial [Candidatus Electrothrix sp. AUS4]|nr:hypothetical protein [Candidatus Electrothrix sp. AUS4]
LDSVINFAPVLGVVWNWIKKIVSTRVGMFWFPVKGKRENAHSCKYFNERPRPKGVENQPQSSAINALHSYWRKRYEFLDFTVH